MNTPNGVPDLAQSGRIAVRESKLITVAAVDVNPGGMSQPGCVAYLRVIDVATATAWLIPLPERTLRGIDTQVQAVLSDVTNTPNP